RNPTQQERAAKRHKGRKKESAFFAPFVPLCGHPRSSHATSKLADSSTKEFASRAVFPNIPERLKRPVRSRARIFHHVHRPAPTRSDATIPSAEKKHPADAGRADAHPAFHP